MRMVTLAIAIFLLALGDAQAQVIILPMPSNSSRVIFVTPKAVQACESVGWKTQQCERIKEAERGIVASAMAHRIASSDSAETDAMALAECNHQLSPEECAKLSEQHGWRWRTVAALRQCRPGTTIWLSPGNKSAISRGTDCAAVLRSLPAVE